MTESLQIPEWLELRLGKPVAIFGAGASGQAARDLASFIGAEATIFDEKLGADFEQNFDKERAADFGLVVASPGFSEDHPWFDAARLGGCEIVPEFDFGAAFWRGPLIAVTGTNGKTTPTEFLQKSFQSSGTEAFAVGNIGTPLSSLIANGCNIESVAVCEVSSFQAAELKKLKPDFVLWTNFDEDHLDRHGDMESYFAAKYRLVELAGVENCFYGESVRKFASTVGLHLEESGLIDFSEDVGALGIRGTVFERLPELKNYLMARALWIRMGFSESELIEAAHAFRKSPHRMELVRNHNGVSFWDDSKATNFHATLGGLSRFSEPVVWIGGGKGKGGNLDNFCERLASEISEAHLIGETALEMKKSLEQRGINSVTHHTLEAAVDRAFENSKPGANVLLSPGFASFDMFDGFKHRGEIFRKAVNAL